MANLKNSNLIDNHSLVELAGKQVGKPCIYFNVLDYGNFEALKKLSELLKCEVTNLMNNQSLFILPDITDCVWVCNQMATKQFRSIYVAAIHPEKGLWHTNNN